MKTQIAILDDHELIAKAISSLVQMLEDYHVMYEVFSGEELIQRFGLKMIPDILLLDINMPGMNGYDVAQWVKNNYPGVKIVALSMNDTEEAIVNILRCGAVGYLQKGCKPYELRQALDSVVQKGFYYTEYVTSKLIRNLNPDHLEAGVGDFGLNQREKHFLQLSCSDLTYVEIADKMCVSPRTVDGYRESIFQKMDVKSRVGMVMKAIKFNLVDPL